MSKSKAMGKSKELDPFFSFWHNCPCCGKLVDDGSADGRCFGCLNAAAKRDAEKQSKHTPK